MFLLVVWIENSYGTCQEENVREFETTYPAVEHPRHQYDQSSFIAAKLVAA